MTDIRKDLSKKLARCGLLVFLGAAGVPHDLEGAVSQDASQAVAPAAARVPARRFFIKEYKITGSKKLGRRAVEEAVWPFLGPKRTEEDCEFARAALEKAYQDAGYQTVSVTLPSQSVDSGVIELKVVERKVGRLRVHGALYSSPRKIISQVPSLAEGQVIDFNKVPGEIVALNQLPDRQVTPSLKPGVTPDTVDVDLEVKEGAPVHAGVELNNRQSANTRPLRVNVSVSANNIAQSGQAAGLSFQTAPEAVKQVKVISAYYLGHFSGVDWLGLMLQGTKQDSNVSTLGGAAVAGRGSNVGLKALFTLPGVEGFTQSASLGVDFKHNDQTLKLSSSSSVVTPINYIPFSAGYSAQLASANRKHVTDLNLNLTFHARGVISNDDEFELNRYLAGGSFVFLHGDVSHTWQSSRGWQVFGRIQGQLSDQPLLSGEQASGGGIGTARGYLESEQVGDSSLFGTIELRLPKYSPSFRGRKIDLQAYTFVDSGWLKVLSPLKDQKGTFDFGSAGLGLNLQFAPSFSGSVIGSVPFLEQGTTKAGHPKVSFQASLNY